MYHLSQILWLEMCSGSTDWHEEPIRIFEWIFVVMLIFLSVYTEIKTKHWTCCVTKCTFLTPKYNECDYLAKLLSQLEHFMIELPDDFNNFSTTKPARWLEYIGTSIFVCNTVQFQLLLKLEYFWLSEDWIISTGRLKIQVLIFSWK